MKKQTIRLNESQLQRVIKESIKKILQEQIRPDGQMTIDFPEEDFETVGTIPSNFCERKYNVVDLGGHKLSFTLIGWSGKRYREKVTVIRKDGKKLEKLYTQHEDDSCKWTMYEVYETLCKKLGIVPAEFGPMI